MKSSKYIIAPFFFIILLSFGSTKNTDKKIQEKLGYVVENLEKASFKPIRVGWQHDYGLADGGVLNKFEYIRSLLSYREFQSMLDYPIYLSGPHSDNTLNLRSKFKFGHYNPKFVSDLRDNIKELVNNQYFVKYTKPILEKYDFLDLLERYDLVYNETKNLEVETNKIKKTYLDGLKNQTWEESSYGYVLPEKIKSEPYWNWGETSYHFWIRRDIDGTKEIWSDIINDILNAYK